MRERLDGLLLGLALFAFSTAGNLAFAGPRGMSLFGSAFAVLAFPLVLLPAMRRQHPPDRGTPTLAERSRDAVRIVWPASLAFVVLTAALAYLRLGPAALDVLPVLSLATGILAATLGSFFALLFARRLHARAGGGP